MTVSARQAHDTPAPTHASQDASVKSAGAWVNQFSRTLKTCRLYDATNPTVVKFRDEFATSTARLLDEFGALTFRFTSEDVLLDDASVYLARSRDDNLAFPFHRDGIRAITLSPGVEPAETNSLLNALLKVTGQSLAEDDLVTLLWEANLRHIEVDFVPAQGEVGAGPGDAASDENAVLLPWPTGGANGLEEGDASATAVAMDETAATGAPREGEGQGRADDWPTGEQVHEIEASFEELDSLAVTEVKRFRHELELEHQVPLVTSTVAIANACLASGATAEDRTEFGQFLPRVLRQSVGNGSWLEAREALGIMRQCANPEWSVETFTQELLQPISITSTVERLDKQEGQAVFEMIAFARELGEPAVDWLTLVLAESQQRRNRRLLAEAIAGLCQKNPERLAPWLSDPRWYVVRNVVHILGWIGGDSIVGMLKVAVRHADPRVRAEVVSALARVDLKLARPLLLRLLESGDARLFCSVLQTLSAARDTGLARLLMGHLQDPAFEQRPLAEQRAIYTALGAVGGDEMVPELEAEIHRGNWFSRTHEIHRQAVARCLARINTPLARAALEQGVQSKRGPVKTACEQALLGNATHE